MMHMAYLVVAQREVWDAELGLLLWSIEGAWHLRCIEDLVGRQIKRHDPQSSNHEHPARFEHLASMT